MCASSNSTADVTLPETLHVWLQMTLQQICADVNRAQAWGRHTCPDSSQKNTSGKPSTGKAVPKMLKVRKGLLGCQTRYLLKCIFISAVPQPTSASNLETRGNGESRKQTHVPSYQQINCVDNIIRCVETALS